jgi:hypothetical protein
MTDKVILVTPPDDILIDGIRILLVDLNSSQTQLISDALNRLTGDTTVISYMWNSKDNIDWLLDKKLKSQLIIFNADSENEIIVGYMAAQKNSHYFGILRSLTAVNNSAIYNTDQIHNLLENVINQNG